MWYRRQNVKALADFISNAMMLSIREIHKLNLLISMY